MPGGFDRLGGVLPRKPGLDYGDLDRLSTLTVRDAGAGVLGEYRLERAPRVSGDRMAVSPDTAGWQAHLQDDRTVSALIVDRDLSKWAGPSSQRRLDLIGFNAPHQSDAQQTWDGTDPALQFTISGSWVSPTMPRDEAWYDAGAGNAVSYVRFGWSGSSATGEYDLLVGVASDGAATTTETSADLYSTARGIADFRPSARFRYARMVWRAATSPSGRDGSTFEVSCRAIQVHGNHPIAPIVSSLGTPLGYLASDIVAHVISRFAPLLKFTPGINGTIQPSSFIIPQAVYSDRTTVAEIINDVSKYELPYWAVWEDRTFWYYQPGSVGYPGRRWRARVGPSGLEETGPQIDRVWNGILVSYQDPDGSTRTVGPPGSGADIETPQLLDQDPLNPANQLPGLRRWDLLNMGMVSTAAAATAVGARFLQEAKQLETAGRAVFTGWVEDEAGVVWPYHKVRSGDTVSFVDAADPSPRRIVGTTKDAEANTCSVDLDSPRQGLDALLARLGVVLVPLGL